MANNNYRLYALGTTLLVAATIIVLRPESNDGANTQDAQSANNSGTNSRRHGLPERKPSGVRGANAPSLSASDDVAAILSMEHLSHDETAFKFSELVLDPSRSIDERTEAMDHMCILTDSYRPGPLIKVSRARALPPTLARLVIHESYNRSDRLQGELLTNLLLNRNQQIRAEAISELEDLTEQNHGEDLDAWQRSVSRLSDD